jgi:CheY-like chemotaxis protein
MIGVQCPPGQGSVFHFEVPLPEEDGVPDMHAEKVQKDDHRRPVSLAEQGVSILMVDDSEDNRLLITALLRQTPHRVVAVTNGVEGVAAFKAGSYGLVLMDMQMPVMDGYTATRQIRAWETEHGLRTTPIIALTAYAMKEDKDKTHAAGCTFHLSKPIRKDALLDAIQRLLSTKS